MTEKFKADVLKLGRVVLVCFLLLNILLPNLASLFFEFFPSNRNKLNVSWSFEKMDMDQEDEKGSDEDKEKEKEFEKDFFIQIDRYSLIASLGLINLSKYFLDKGYPNQIFPITIPPPKVF